MMVKSMITGALIGTAVLLACACGKEAPPAASGKIEIAVIPKGTTHEFWKSIHAGAEMAKSELEDVEVIWKGPLKEDDREAQIAVMENFITRKVNGIVLAPLDDMALRVPVRSAVQSGIPVVIIDSGLNSDDYVSFVATDNYKGGKLGGEHLARLLEGKGKVIMLRYQEGSASTMKREQGFLDAMAEHESIEIVSSNLHGGATTESAFRQSENLLAPLMNGSGGLNIDGIFCPNESTTFGMLRALQDARLAGKVYFVGFDSSPKLIEAMENGEIHGLVLQNPMRMGYLGVKTMVAHLQGKPAEKRIDTGVKLITPENMTEPESQELLRPDFSKWLK